MKIIFFLVPILYLFVLLFQSDQSFTQDLGRHLLLGQLIIECLCVPKTNMFSYTAPDFPFINHHWFPEVVFYLLQKFAGLQSLLWFKVIAILTAFSLSAYTALKQSNHMIAMILAIPLVFILSERLDMRPEIFSFVYLAITMFLSTKYLQSNNIRYLFPLPIIQFLWVNSHIYFFLGPLIFGLLTLHLLLHKKLTLNVVSIGIFSLLVMIINPNGLTGLLYPLNVFGNYGYTIVENQNIFFLNTFFFNPRILIFEIMVVVAVILSVVQIKKRKFFDLFCILFGCIAGIMMIRNFPLFVFMAFPGMSAAAHQLIQGSNIHKKLLVQRILLVCVFVFALASSISVVTSPNFGLRFLSGAEKGVQFFKANNLSGNIFNNFDIGSYLIYSLYPEQKVFVDGRPEAYPAEFFDEYKKMQTDQTLFERQVMRYDINTVFFTHTDITPWAQEFLRSIAQNQDWVPIYIDERVVIFVRNNAENKELISKFNLSANTKN